MLLKCSLYSCDHPGDARTALRLCAMTLSINTYKDAASCFNHTMSSFIIPDIIVYLKQVQNGGRRVSRVVGVHLNKQRDVTCPCLTSYNTTKPITNCWKQAWWRYDIPRRTCCARRQKAHTTQEQKHVTTWDRKKKKKKPSSSSGIKGS